MNSITDLLDLEDTDIFISDISIQDQTKTITLETRPVGSLLPILRFQNALAWSKATSHQSSYSPG